MTKPNLRLYKRLFFSLVGGLFLAALSFAIACGVSSGLGYILRIVAGTHLILMNDKNEAPLVFAFLGLAFFPYALLYMPLSACFAAFKLQKAHILVYIKKRFILETALSILLCTLLWTTGVYIA